MASRNPAITDQYKAIAADLLKAYNGEMSVFDALVKNGIAEGQARKGWTTVKDRKGLWTAFQSALTSEQASQAALPEPSPELDVRLINHRLRSNIKEGKDKAVLSAKLLGSRKDLNMWQPESMTGIVILEAPKSLPTIPGYTVETQPDPAA
jgi:hypothetical protein